MEVVRILKDASLILGKTELNITENTDVSLMTSVTPVKLTEVKETNLSNWYVDIEVRLKDKEKINQDYIVLVPTKSKGVQPFRMVGREVGKRKVTTRAHHVMFDSELYVVEERDVSNATTLRALNELNQSLDRVSPFTYTVTHTASVTHNFSRLSLQEAWGILVSEYGAIIDANWYNISFKNEMGTDRGITISHGKDLEDIKGFEDWKGVVTRIFPQTRDGVTLPEKYIDSVVQYTRPYARVIEIEVDMDALRKERPGASDEVLRPLIERDLRQAAVKYLETSQYPMVSYQVNSNVKEDLDLWDPVIVKHPAITTVLPLSGAVTQEMIDKIGIPTSVKSYTYDVISKRTTQIEYGDFTMSLGQAFNGKLESIEKELGFQEGYFEERLKDQTDLINNWNKKGHLIIEENEILFLDKLPKEAAEHILRIGLGGIGFSKTGIDGDFEIAWDINGSFNTDFIGAGQIRTNHLASDVGSSLDISSNVSVRIAVEDGLREASFGNMLINSSGEFGNFTHWGNYSEKGQEYITCSDFSCFEPVYIGDTPANLYVASSDYYEFGRINNQTGEVEVSATTWVSKDFIRVGDVLTRSLTGQIDIAFYDSDYKFLEMPIEGHISEEAIFPSGGAEYMKLVVYMPGNGMPPEDILDIVITRGLHDFVDTYYPAPELGGPGGVPTITVNKTFPLSSFRGGRNLLLDTGDTSITLEADSDYTDYNTGTQVQATDYTLTFDIDYVEELTTPLKIALGLGTKDGDEMFRTLIPNTDVVDEETASYTFSVPSAYIEEGNDTFYYRLTNSNQEISIGSRVQKLERGVVATPYSPAPEDGYNYTGNDGSYHITSKGGELATKMEVRAGESTPGAPYRTRLNFHTFNRVVVSGTGSIPNTYGPSQAGRYNERGTGASGLEIGMNIGTVNVSDDLDLVAINPSVMDAGNLSPAEIEDDITALSGSKMVFVTDGKLSNGAFRIQPDQAYGFRYRMTGFLGKMDVNIISYDSDFNVIDVKNFVGLDKEVSDIEFLENTEYIEVEYFGKRGDEIADSMLAIGPPKDFSLNARDVLNYSKTSLELLTDRIDLSVTRDDFNSSMEITAEKVSTEISNTRATITGLEEELTSLIEATSESFEIEFTRIEQEIQEGQVSLNELKTYYRFNDDEAIVGKEGDPVQFYYSNDEAGYRENGQRISYWKGRIFYVEDLHILSSILIGQHIIQSEGSNTKVRNI